MLLYPQATEMLNPFRLAIAIFVDGGPDYPLLECFCPYDFGPGIMGINLGVFQHE